MHGIYTYIPKTNYVPSEYSVAAILLFLFMVHTSLARVESIALLHKYFPKCACIIIIITIIIIIIIKAEID